jgi:hypothetical protein
VAALVELSNGATLRLERRAGESEVAAIDYEQGFAQVLPAITGLCEDLSTALRTVRPDKAKVEFGIKLEFETSKLLAVLCSSSAAADLKLTLEWQFSEVPPQ